MKKTALRSGITTGTCAAAAAKAAVLAWRGETPVGVEVVTPQDRVLQVAVADSRRTATGGTATVIKDAGDDPDVTHGSAITATVVINDSGAVSILGGTGVGKVTKPGLAVPVGEAAINPGPRRMITMAVHSALPAGHGAAVTIAIPDGERLAARTLNPVLGIAGGLSIIGTTGIVEPMSEEAFKNSLTPQLSVLRALGHDIAVLVPGKIGQDIAVRYGLPQQQIVQTSNYLGHMLEQAVVHDMHEVLLLGHLGKLVKVAAGVFHTHNRVADARLETLAAHAAACGLPAAAVEEILAAATTEAAHPVLVSHGLADAVYRRIAQQAGLRAERYVFGELTVGVAIVTLAGELLGLNETAANIGGKLGWTVKLS